VNIFPLLRRKEIRIRPSKKGDGISETSRERKEKEEQIFRLDGLKKKSTAPIIEGRKGRKNEIGRKKGSLLTFAGRKI